MYTTSFFITQTLMTNQDRKVKRNICCSPDIFTFEDLSYGHFVFVLLLQTAREARRIPSSPGHVCHERLAKRLVKTAVHLILPRNARCPSERRVYVWVCVSVCVCTCVCIEMHARKCEGTLRHFNPCGECTGTASCTQRRASAWQWDH